MPDILIHPTSRTRPRRCRRAFPTPAWTSRRRNCGPVAGALAELPPVFAVDGRLPGAGGDGAAVRAAARPVRAARPAVRASALDAHRRDPRGRWTGGPGSTPTFAALTYPWLRGRRPDRRARRRCGWCRRPATSPAWSPPPTSRRGVHRAPANRRSPGRSVRACRVGEEQHARAQRGRGQRRAHRRRPRPAAARAPARCARTRTGASSTSAG